MCRSHAGSTSVAPSIRICLDELNMKYSLTPLGDLYQDRGRSLGTKSDQYVREREFGLTLSTLDIVNVLRCLARGHQGIHSADTELAMTQVTKKGVGRVDKGE